MHLQGDTKIRNKEEDKSSLLISLFGRNLLRRKWFHGEFLLLLYIRESK